MKTIIISIAISCLVTLTSSAEIIGTTIFDGKTYFVDMEKQGSNVNMYFRKNNISSDKDDLLIAVFALQKEKKNKVKDILQTMCTTKKYYDNAKTIVGCSATIGAATCLVLAAPEGELPAALFCSSTIKLALKTGLKDCIEGIKDKVADSIAEYLDKDKEWSKYKVIINASKGKYKEAFKASIDDMCKQIE